MCTKWASNVDIDEKTSYCILYIHKGPHVIHLHIIMLYYTPKTPYKQLTF